MVDIHTYMHTELIIVVTVNNLVREKRVKEGAKSSPLPDNHHTLSTTGALSRGVDQQGGTGGALGATQN